MTDAGHIGSDASALLARELAGRRLAAQMLSGEPGRSVLDVVQRLLVVQGQDPRGARLAIRSRSRGLTAADVDKALTTDRSLLVTWLNRGTLHLIRSEDYWLLHGLMVRQQHEDSCLRVLAASGVTPDRADEAVQVITGALESEGPLSRAQLRDRLVRSGIPAGGNAPLHVLLLTCQRGLAIRGPMIGNQQAIVLVRDWLGAARGQPDREVALAELARRYLAGHGPSSERDLAKWSGLPVGQVRRGLTAIAPQLRDRDDGLAELSGSPANASGLPAPKLLGSFDEVLHGWVDRGPILGSHKRIVTSNGLFRPFALVDGKAAGIWTWSDGQVQLDGLDELPTEARAAIDEEARDVQRFLRGEPRLPAMESTR